jgi:hypothetical protein
MRLRFTIRDLLWLTVVAALAVGWSADRDQLARKVNDLTEQLRAKNNQTNYDYYVTPQISDYYSNRAK